MAKQSDENTNNVCKNTTQETKDWATWTPLKSGKTKYVLNDK